MFWLSVEFDPQMSSFLEIVDTSDTVGDFTFLLKTFAETFAEPKLRSKCLLTQQKVK